MEIRNSDTHDAATFAKTYLMVFKNCNAEANLQKKAKGTKLHGLSFLIGRVNALIVMEFSVLFYSKSILSCVGINDVLELTVVHYIEFTIYVSRCVVKKVWASESKYDVTPRLKSGIS